LDPIAEKKAEKKRLKKEIKVYQKEKKDLEELIDEKEM